MKLKMLILYVCISHDVFGMLSPLKKPQAAAPAPLVSLMFGNSSNSLENVFTLVQTGDYFGNKSAGAYYPEFLPSLGTIKRDTFSFDPGVLLQGPNAYPFMFSYKGAYYYLVFVTSKVLEEKAELPFFASIIKVAGIDQKSNSAKIDTIANLYFKSNDMLALIFKNDNFDFYNITQKTKAGFIKESEAPVKLVPNKLPKAQKVSLKPVTKPRVATPLEQSMGPANKVLLKPNKMPAAAQPRN